MLVLLIHTLFAPESSATSLRSTHRQLPRGLNVVQELRMRVLCNTGWPASCHMAESIYSPKQGPAHCFFVFYGMRNTGITKQVKHITTSVNQHLILDESCHCKKKERQSASVRQEVSRVTELYQGLQAVVHAHLATECWSLDERMKHSLACCSLWSPCCGTESHLRPTPKNAPVRDLLWRPSFHANSLP